MFVIVTTKNKTRLLLRENDFMDFHGLLTKVAYSELLKPYPRKMSFDYIHAHQLLVALVLQIFAWHEIHQ